ncbi:MAG: VOC family protein [Alphaproteobacteria bacterium]|nr:VOC family protein [Alphaproteobacteria bacterium]
MPKLRHIAIAAKDPDKMAEFYMKAFGFKEVRRGDSPLAYGYHLTDGTIDLAILRFKTDQIGKGMDYTGLHHFGVLVADVDAFAKKLEGLGARHYLDESEGRVGGFEVKFHGPEGVLFDVSEHPWTGTAGLDEDEAAVREAAE